MCFLLRLQVVVSLLLATFVFGAMGFGAAFPGDEIAFQTRGSFYFAIDSLDVRTGLQHTLYSEPSWHSFAPAWSPDGTQIAFITIRGNDAEAILCIAESGGANRRCASTGSSRGARPTWSPDGANIAFIGDGGIRIADSNALDQPPLALHVGDSGVAWSPNGLQIAYVTPDEATFNIHILDLSTRESRWLANGFAPAWSPDGTQIAYSHGSQVLMIAAIAGTPVPITDGSDPAWSPDGVWLAFVRGSGMARADLMLRHLESGREFTLVTNGSINVGASWRPR
jgi:Tol biopolymer transport system component